MVNFFPSERRTMLPPAEPFTTIRAILGFFNTNVPLAAWMLLPSQEKSACSVCSLVSASMHFWSIASPASSARVLAAHIPNIPSRRNAVNFMAVLLPAVARAQRLHLSLPAKALHRLPPESGRFPERRAPPLPEADSAPARPASGFARSGTVCEAYSGSADSHASSWKYRRIPGRSGVVYHTRP